MQKPLRWECECCGWQGLDSDFLRAKNPFGGNDEILGCPTCKSVNEFMNACDECWAPATCGTPTPDGYKRLCGKHYAAVTANMGAKK